MKIKAFSIMELLVVLAVTSLLIGFFYTSMNQFQAYLKNKTQATTETTQFQLFKSNLRQELFLSDSLQLKPNNLIIYISSDSISYKSNSDQQVIRHKETTEKLFEQIYFESLESYEIKAIPFIKFSVRFKDEIIQLVSPKYSSVNHEVNAFFNQEHGTE